MKLVEKIKEIKNDILHDDESEVKRFMITILIVVMIVLVMFVFTKYVINDGDIKISVFESLDGNINYNVASVGTMLGKADSEYYVYAYSSESRDSYSYQILAAAYAASYEEGTLPIYHIDTNKYLNKSFLATEDKPENVDAKTIEDISFGEISLLKIENGKIVKYLNTIEDIKTELNINN